MGGQWSYPNNIINHGELYTYTNSVTLNQWQHFVFSIDSTGSNNIMNIYIDGVDQNLYSYACVITNYAGCTPTNITANEAWRPLNGMTVGSFFHVSGQFKYPFDGKIDELSTWNKALSQSEVTTLYNSGNGNTPDSINSNNNLITYLNMDDTSFPIPNMAVTTDPITTTYSVNRDGSQIATTTSTTYSDSPTLGNSYNYLISASTTYGTSGNSSTVNIQTGSPPDAPTGVSVTIPTPAPNQLTPVVSWSSPANVGSGTLTGFEVYRNGSLITTTGLVTSYTDTVTAGSHSYYLKSVSTHGTSGNSSTANITTPGVPGAITDLAGLIISDSQINLSWTAPNNSGSNIDLYKIFKDGVQVDTTTNTSYSLTGLTANTAYAVLVVANNSVGDSANSNSVSLTTHTPVTGSITVTPTTQGATTKIEFVPNVTAGSPTPIFSTFTLKEGNTIIASGITSPYYYHHNDNIAHTLTITATDNSHWDTPTITGSASVTSAYLPSWNSKNMSYDYSRAGGVFTIMINENNNQSTWDATCTYKTSAQVMAETAGITSTNTGVWHISEAHNLADTDTVYVTCTDGTDTLFSFTSFGPNRLGGGISMLDDFYSDFTGTPVALIFVLLVAGLFTGRTAPTGILLVLALVGVLGFVGLLTIDHAVWGFLLLAGVLGIFLGKRFL
jgi:hypothetical protein